MFGWNEVNSCDYVGLMILLCVVFLIVENVVFFVEVLFGYFVIDIYV